MEEFMKIFNKINSLVRLIVVTLNATFGTEWVLFAGYLILNITDYITGTIKAKVKTVENSCKGLLGVLKKIGYWILIFIAFFTSFLLVQLGYKINIQLDFIMLFGWFTLACLIINEVRSILENLVEIGVKVPTGLLKGLEVYQNILDKKIKKTKVEK